MEEFSGNGTWINTEGDFEITYRVVASVLHISIFFTGLLGNLGLMFVVYKSKKLHTPTYAYLVSMAAADMIVILTAVPEAIAFQYVGERWLLGEAGCALFVFCNFFGINAGSLSLLAFTSERYIAGCRPLLAQKICTLERTRKIIVLCWLLALVYCAPWLFLTEVRRDHLYPELDQCQMRLSPTSYAGIFTTDLVAFYLIPLLVAMVSYGKIAKVLRERSRRFSTRKRSSVYGLHPHHDNSYMESAVVHANEQLHVPLKEHDFISQTTPFCHRESVRTEQAQGLRMMIVIVVLFAVCWLPFRGLLLYNTFVQEPWLDIWYLLFAKTMIYFSCAINPFLYNILCRRFRVAVREIILRKSNTLHWLGRNCAHEHSNIAFL